MIGAALFIAACSEPPPSAAPAAPATTAEPDDAAPPVVNIDEATDRPTIVMLGDSLTAGFGLAPEESLPARVEAELDAGGLAARVVNAGVSGDTTANGLARYDWSVSAAAPDLLIIALGANDYLLGLSSDLARENLSEILTRAAADSVPVILVGLEPRTDAPAGSRDAAFASIYPDLSAAFSAPLYPAILEGVRDNPEFLQGDGLHPTAEGVEIMATKLARFLAPHVAALSPRD